MRIKHPAVRSAVFKCVRVIELDVQLGEGTVTFRIELFQDTQRKRHYRARLWELELFRLRPTFPQDKSGRPKDIADDMLMAERSWSLSEEYEGFMASSPDSALKFILKGLNERLEHWSGVPAKRKGT
jgi:hypothetical protein